MDEPILPGRALCIDAVGSGDYKLGRLAAKRFAAVGFLRRRQTHSLDCEAASAQIDESAT
jgi:hypothetical protein